LPIALPSFDVILAVASIMATPPIDAVQEEDAQVELSRPAELETLEWVPLGKPGLQMLMIPPRSRGLVEIDLVDIVGPGGQNVGLEFLKQDNFLSKSWMLIASEHLKQGRLEMADRTLLEGLGGEQDSRR
jgi:hypothetical protein